MTEEQIQIALARYITIKDQNVLFHNDFGSGTRLSMSQAKRQKAMNPKRGHPDFILYEPRNVFSGLAIELKRDNVKLTIISAEALEKTQGLFGYLNSILFIFDRISYNINK